MYTALSPTCAALPSKWAHILRGACARGGPYGQLRVNSFPQCSHRASLGDLRRGIAFL